MLDFFARLFDGDFMPHGHCYLWKPAVLWLNVGSDIAIALAYFSIPLALLSFARRRRDFPYPWLLVLFAAFIVSCGFTHLIDVVTTWTGTYRLEGVLKLVTAVVSVATAVLLWPLVPKLVALPSPRELALVNGELERKIESLELAEAVAGIGNWRLDLQTGSLHWSPEVYRIHGFDPAGPPPSVEAAIAAYHPDDRATLQATSQRVLEHRESFDDVLRVVRPDGAIRCVRSIGRVEVDAKTGQSSAIFGVVLDVTEEYRRREELERIVAERTEQLRRVNGELEQFAYAASHDLKEPLRMVSSYVSLLERRFGHVLEERGRRYVAHAVDGATRMSALIDGLLSFSQTSRAELCFEPVALDELVEEVRANVRSLLRSKKARLEVRTPLPEVVVIRLAVQQVLQNLVSNAVKYSGAEPHVRLSARRDEQAGAWVIEVEDDGEGVPAEHRERIFEPFVRLHGRELADGTGMGLAISRRLAERGGGRLWVQRAAGGGALFCLSLPDHEPSDPSSRADSRTPPSP